MKLLDTIEIINDNYANLGIPKGTKGIIVLAEIRGNAFDCELLNLLTIIIIWDFVFAFAQ